MKFSYKRGIACSIIAVMVSSCNKNEGASSPPSAFQASFKIYENILGLKYFETDTIVNYEADFTAPEGYDSYAWTVGSDPAIHKEHTLHLNFPLSATGKTIGVTLIASKNGERDTVEKTLTVMAVRGTKTGSQLSNSVLLPYLGKFEGSYEDAPEHKFVMTITDLGPAPAGNQDLFFYDFRVYNLPEGCGADYRSGQACMVTDMAPSHYAYPFEYAYKAFYVKDGYDLSCCPPVTLWGSLDSVNRNKLFVECGFLYTDSTGKTTTTQRKFIGLRI